VSGLVSHPTFDDPPTNRLRRRHGDHRHGHFKARGTRFGGFGSSLLLLGLFSSFSGGIAPGHRYYPNCAAARAAGAPIHEGEPGYRPALEADSDGIVCEPYAGT
jgi:hypothetical protein